MTAAECFEWVQTDQVKSHLSPWFSDACAAVKAHRDHFFHFLPIERFPASKVEFSQASNCCKRALEPANPPYSNKTKESITSQKLSSYDF